MSDGNTQDEDDEKTERVQVGLWVTPEMRDDWDTYAGKLGFESRGAMIRNAVRYFYFAQMHGERDKILKRIEEMHSKSDRIENKLDSVKIDQLEHEDIETIATAVEDSVTREIFRRLSEVDSIEEIDAYQGTDA